MSPSERGAVVWITGLPGAGKTTLAHLLGDLLSGLGRPAVHLDGDEVREALVPAPGHDPAGRDAFYRTLARMAALIARQGMTVIVAATAHQRLWRDEAQRLAPRFLEVYVDVPVGECRRRDPKGLYAAADRGEITDLPGLGVPYEPPLAPGVVAAGGRDLGGAQEIVDWLRDTTERI